MSQFLRIVGYFLLIAGLLMAVGSLAGAYLRGGILTLADRFTPSLSNFLGLVIWVLPGLLLLNWASRRDKDRRE